MSVWSTQAYVDQMPHVSTQFHIIPAVVMRVSFPILEWKIFTMVTMSHA